MPAGFVYDGISLKTYGPLGQQLSLKSVDLALQLSDLCFVTLQWLQWLWQLAVAGAAVVAAGAGPRVAV